MRFILRASIRKILTTLSNSSDVDSLPSASVADFFNSFESHRRPVLLSIAALHRITVQPGTNIEKMRTQLIDHIVSAKCAESANLYTFNSSAMPGTSSLPHCADVFKEWQVNPIDPDLQVHVLSALNGSKVTIVPLHRLLSSLNVPYESSESFRSLCKS